VFDVEELLAPIDQGKPCGDDLEYDAEMLALEQAARYRAERQFGATVIPAAEPDWRDVQARCEAMLARTKDLRSRYCWRVPCSSKKATPALCAAWV